MKKSKLLAHQQVKHPSSVRKELSYFEKRWSYGRSTLQNLYIFFGKRQEIIEFGKKQETRDNNRKTLKVGYIVSEIIAKVGKPHTIAERLVKPAMLICAKELIGEQAANILQKIPSSDDTVKRRQDEMA